jgi:hypothetical protein
MRNWFLFVPIALVLVACSTGPTPSDRASVPSPSFLALFTPPTPAVPSPHQSNMPTAIATIFPMGSEAPSPLAIVISCQPYGYSPAPASLSVYPGPKTQTEAVSIATDFYTACEDPSKKIDNLSTSATWETGSPTGPNAGQRVWDVKVDAEITEPSGASYGSHFWIEVNASTGIPTLIAYG